MLTTHQPAPDFSTFNQHNESINLNDFRGSKNVVLYFYPKDDTPGCTIEANQFTALVDDFAALDTVILGVSKDSAESHQDFIEKFDIGFDLLADTDGKLCESYEVWQQKEKNGVKKMGIVRSTFIIDKEGKLAMVVHGVDPQGHAEQVLARVKSLS
jgi:peroxiredoxin